MIAALHDLQHLLLAVTRDELPYSIATRVTEWEGNHIRVEIIVERESQKRIEQLNERIEALRSIERSFSRPNSSHTLPSSGGNGNGGSNRPGPAP